MNPWIIAGAFFLLTKASTAQPTSGVTVNNSTPGLAEALKAIADALKQKNKSPSAPPSAGTKGGGSDPAGQFGPNPGMTQGQFDNYIKNENQGGNAVDLAGTTPDTGGGLLDLQSFDPYNPPSVEAPVDNGNQGGDYGGGGGGSDNVDKNVNYGDSGGGNDSNGNTDYGVY